MLRAMIIIALAALAQPVAAASPDTIDTSNPRLDAREMPQVAPVNSTDEIAQIRPRMRPAHIATIVELNQMPLTFAGASDLTCMAVAIYHEARGEPRKGQEAVASVIMQRVAVRHRWGDSICEVVVPVQFSFLDAEGRFAPITEVDAWLLAVEIASAAIAKGPNPILRAADHYHRVDVFPSWRTKMIVVAQIDDHIFYADPASRSDG